MKTKSYSVVGDKKQGHRIAVPESTGVQKGDRFTFMYYEDSTDDVIPAGSLVYVPAPRPVCKREKKVSG